jgi:HD superfamily phosphohydrolase
MILEDAVFGAHRIDEPVLLELLDSAAIVRLKSVLQGGISGLIGINNPTTRFDHSVGVMLLVRRLEGGLEEQMAALLHDASHTAFSHVIDYVFHGHKEQNYHDSVKEKYLSTTDVPEILTRRNYDWRKLIDEEQYPLLEQPAPALCADRIDYFLRDALDLGIAEEAEVSWALSHLLVKDERIVMDDIEAACWFGTRYIEADKKCWANYREVAIYELTAMAIRRALEIGELSEDDFWGGDEELWEKLKESRDEVVNEYVSLINTETTFVWDDENPDFKVSTKIRTIDPDVLVNNRLVKLSELEPSFSEKRKAYVMGSEGAWPVRIESR